MTAEGTALGEPSLWLLVLLPAAAGALLVLAPRIRAVLTVSITVAAVTLLLSIISALSRAVVSAPFLPGLGFSLSVDGLSALLLPTISGVTLLVLIFAARDIHAGAARFHGLMLIFASAALLTAVAANIPTLLFAWEIMGATSYALIGFWWREDERVSGGLTAFLTTRAGDLGLYLAAGAALAGGAGLALADLPQAEGGWRDVIAAGVLIAALGKAAQLPFSFWLSRAMAGPSPVSALLHSAAMVALGAYLLLRAAPLLEATGWAAVTTAWIGAATALLLGIVAVAQRDVKQLLAASTAAQLAFVAMAAGLGAVTGGAAHLVAHAATKAALFLAAGAWLSAIGTKQLDGLAGAARRWRLLGVAASVAALALAGVPPLSLWATKDAVLTVALEHSLWLYLVGLAAAGLSAVYAAKLLFAIWRRPDAASVAYADSEERGTGTVGAPLGLPVAVLAAGAAVLGVVALPPLTAVVAAGLGQPAPEVRPAELVVSAAVAIVLVLAVKLRRPPRLRWAEDWLGLEAFAHAAVVRPTLRIAHALARFDDRVLDRAVDWSAPATLAAAELSARADDGVIDAGVDAAAMRIRAAAELSARADDAVIDGGVDAAAMRIRQLGRISSQPQTGQLHHYYSQAVVLLAAVVVLLVIVR